MPPSSADVLVVNFNAPELNRLALALARQGRLARHVRPYVNKSRGWERALAALPVGGHLYASTLGRRRIDKTLAHRTFEAGIASDWAQALIGRAPGLPASLRHAWTRRLHMRVREAVADAGAKLAPGVPCVVGYEGFALPAFEAARRERKDARLFLNYPVAHHRERRRIRDEELLREPGFAATWPGFDDWGPGHEDRLDREIALADAVLLGSEFAAASFERAGVPRTKLVVAPYGVDLQTFQPADAPSPVRPFEAIYAGQLTQRKGISYLLRAWATFQRPDARLTVVGSHVGDGAALAPWRDLFTHVPHQTRSALAARYRAAHVFVFPTLVEGMPLVVLEAMACGLPVIVTANGPGGIVRDGIDGYIVPERDADAVAQRLHDMYSDPERTAAMGRNAARRAREFSWDRYTADVCSRLDEARRT